MGIQGVRSVRFREEPDALLRQFVGEFVQCLPFDLSDVVLLLYGVRPELHALELTYLHVLRDQVVAQVVYLVEIDFLQLDKLLGIGPRFL